MAELSTQTKRDASTVLDAAPRPTGLLLLVAGLAHLLAPGILLAIASRGYRQFLRVEFEPGLGAPRRVRLVGIGMIAAGGHLLYHGGIRPAQN